MYDGVDVTDQSKIFDITEDEPVELESPSFKPTDAGNYLFSACYMDIETLPLAIQATKKSAEIEGKFFRRSMIMKFTATWCLHCPGMSEAIQSVEMANPGRVIDISVHHIDEFTVDDGRRLIEYFNVSAVPIAVVNLDKSTKTSIASSALLSASLNRVVTENLPACGIKLASAKENGMVVVDVETTIAGDGNYKIAVALLEDGIVKEQTGGGAEYLHNSVLRDMLQQSAMGDGLGDCKKGEVIKRRYQAPADNLNSNGKYRLVAYLLKECGKNNYLVNNVTEAPLFGSVDYIYESEE